MYRFESQLVKDIKIILNECQNPFDITDVAFEFNFNSGRVDVLGKTESGDLFAFEAKLTRWRKALNQAYRYSSFAHYSYVILPLAAAEKAKKAEDEFKRRGIGLCSVDSHIMKLEIPATKMKPLQPWLTENAMNYTQKE